MDHTHKVISKDGTEIVGRVFGQGPALVLLPPGPGESESAWRFLVPYLSNRFTCYLMNTRGRGLSADHHDHSPAKLVEDVITFVESIGQSVVLVEAGSGLWAYSAATNHPGIGAVAVYEPGVDEVMPDTLAKRLEEVFVKVAEFAAEGHLNEAAGFFIENSHILYTKEELATGIPKVFWQEAAENIPVFLVEEGEKANSEVMSPTDRSVLSKIEVPVLLIKGIETTTWFINSVNYVAEHVNNPYIREIQYAAHFGIWTHPECVAEVLEWFYTTKLE